MLLKTMVRAEHPMLMLIWLGFLWIFFIFFIHSNMPNRIREETDDSIILDNNPRYPRENLLVSGIGVLVGIVVLI